MASREVRERESEKDEVISDEWREETGGDGKCKTGTKRRREGGDTDREVIRLIHTVATLQPAV